MEKKGGLTETMGAVERQGGRPAWQEERVSDREGRPSDGFKAKGGGRAQYGGLKKGKRKKVGKAILL